MSLIQPEKKTTNEQLNVTLSSETLQEVRAYGRFLNNSSVSYVLTQLIATLGRDKEFQQWKAGQTGLGSEPPVVRPQKEHVNGKSA
jgi:post-segregation antitoxin (ccd killing protein)